jgi:hypothetical protein
LIVASGHPEQLLAARATQVSFHASAQQVFASAQTHWRTLLLLQPGVACGTQQLSLVGQVRLKSSCATTSKKLSHCEA